MNIRNKIHKIKESRTIPLTYNGLPVLLVEDDKPECIFIYNNIHKFGGYEYKNIGNSNLASMRFHPRTFLKIGDVYIVYYTKEDGYYHYVYNEYDTPTYKKYKLLPINITSLIIRCNKYNITLSKMLLNKFGIKKNNFHWLSKDVVKYSKKW